MVLSVKSGAGRKNSFSALISSLDSVKQVLVDAVLKAGTDVDCGGFVGKYVASALGNNTITEADIDERLEKLFRVRMRLSHFDPVGPLQGIGADQICASAKKRAWKWSTEAT